MYDTVEDGPIESFVTSKHRPVIVSSSESEDDDDEEGDSGDDDDFVVDDDIVDGKKVDKPVVKTSLPGTPVDFAVNSHILISTSYS